MDDTIHYNPKAQSGWDDERPDNDPWRDDLARSMELPYAREYMPKPRALGFALAIPATESDVLACVMYYSKINRPDRATAAKVAEFIGRPLSTVYRALKRLVDHGLLCREHLEGVRYCKVYRPINEALELAQVIGRKVAAGARGVAKAASKGARSVARAVSSGASKVATVAKGGKKPGNGEPERGNVPYRERLNELVAMSLRTPRKQDMGRIEAAWTDITRDTLPDRVLLAYQSYRKKLVDKDEIMYARSLAGWLEDKNFIRATIAKVVCDNIGEGGRRGPAAKKTFSLANQQRRVEMLAARAGFDQEAALAVAEHRATWSWLPRAMRQFHAEYVTDISGVLSVVQTGKIDEIDLDGLKAALRAEVRVRELFDRTFPNQADLLVPEKPLKPSLYGILDIYAE